MFRNLTLVLTPTLTQELSSPVTPSYYLVLLSLLCSLSFWQSAHIKETFLKKLASCLCVSTGSLIHSHHDSSATLRFESVSLLYSLTPPRWVPIALGSSSWHYDRGKTSAVTPPSVVLTETTDIIHIILTHMLGETTHTRTHTCMHTIQFSNAPASHRQVNTHNDSPSSWPPSFLFLSFGSQHQSAEVQCLWWSYPYWYHMK